jgi:hypothetical protein
MKINAKRPLRDERGQAMLLVLVLLLIGLVIITPVLKFMGTAITSGRVYEQKIDELYAADAGVEDALWHIRCDFVEELLGEDYDEYDYYTDYPYPYDLNINGKDVEVTVQNIWIPKDLDVPSSSEARQIIEDEKLMIIGYPSSEESTYTIKIVYYWESGEDDDLLVETIGVWLSPGFEYDGDCSLAGYYSDEDISLYKGGSAVVWDFDSVPLKNFPVVDNGPPMVATFNFKYTGPEGELPELVSSWIVTTEDIPGTDYNYTWDDSIRLYKIVSEADGVQVEAYGAKTKFRRLKSTISSDYTVAGNRLSQATATSGDDRYYRDRLYEESDSTVLRQALEEVIEKGSADPGKIPEEATIEDVYLYWSGWLDPWYYYWRSRHPSGWRWQRIQALQYNANTHAQLMANSMVDRVKFDIDGSAQTVTADRYQIINTSDCHGSSDAWVYSCFTDVTDLEVSGGMTVREYIEEAVKSDGSGDVTFTLGHADEVRGLLRTSPYEYYNFDLYNIGLKTGYPLATPAYKKPDEGYQIRYQWSYAGWSMIIFYRSPGLKQRYLRLFDDLRYRSYLGGGNDPEFSIGGFLAPPIITEQDTSHLTYFVGEGDGHYNQDSILVNDMYLSDANNPEDNAFNSYSNALSNPNTDGQDVDTFELPEGCILPYDTSAEVTLLTAEEIYTLVYLVLSFRSDLTTGGIITNYSVRVS